MGGNEQRRRLAMSDDDYDQIMTQQLIDDVQFGSDAPRLPLPYRAIPGPQYDPKDVPIVPKRTGRRYDPSFSTSDAYLLANKQSNTLDALIRILRGVA